MDPSSLSVPALIEGAKSALDLWKSLQPKLMTLVEAKSDRYLNYDPSNLLRLYAAERQIANGVTYTEMFHFSSVCPYDATWDESAVDMVGTKKPFVLSEGQADWQEASAAAFTARREEGRTRQNEDSIRLIDCAMTTSGQRKLVLKVQKATYHQQARSNLVLDFDRDNPEKYTTLRKQLAAVYGSKLPPLSDERLANTIGVAALIFYWNGTDLVPYVVKRVQKIGVFPGGLHCTASGVAKWPTERPTPTFRDLTDHMFDELEEEVGLKREDILELRPMALCREMARGGKPPIFYAGVTTLNRSQLKEKRIHASDVVRATTKIPEIERDRWYRNADVVMTPSALSKKLGKWGLTLEAAGSLHYGIQYLERRLPHLPR